MSFCPLRRPGSSSCTSSKEFVIAASSSFSEDWFSERWVLVVVAALLAKSSHFLAGSIEFDLITSLQGSMKKPRIAETFLSFTNSSLELARSIFTQLLEMNLANSALIDEVTNTGNPVVDSCSFLELSRSWIVAKAEVHQGKSYSDLDVREVCVKLEWMHCFPDSNYRSWFWYYDVSNSTPTVQTLVVGPAFSIQNVEEEPAAWALTLEQHLSLELAEACWIDVEILGVNYWNLD
jgi:hypothetical protein